MAEHHLTLPLDEATVRGLGLGDTVYFNGTFVTARDEAHIHALEKAEKGSHSPSTSTVPRSSTAAQLCGTWGTDAGRSWPRDPPPAAA